MIEKSAPLYVSRSDRHFTLTLTEEQYRSVMAIVDEWRRLPQPSYRLKSRNCVHFVAEVATALGLTAPVIPKLKTKPKTFLRKVTAENAARIRDRANPSDMIGPPPSTGNVVANDKLP